MQIDLSESTKIILYVFCGFIIAINLSLVFALRGRARNNTALSGKRKNTRPIWASKIDTDAAELAQRLQELKDQAAKPPGTS